MPSFRKFFKRLFTRKKNKIHQMPINNEPINNDSDSNSRHLKREKTNTSSSKNISSNKTTIGNSSNRVTSDKATVGTTSSRRIGKIHQVKNEYKKRSKNSVCRKLEKTVCNNNNSCKYVEGKTRKYCRKKHNKKINSNEL